MPPPVSCIRRLAQSDLLCAALAIPLGALLLGWWFWRDDGPGPLWAVTSFVLVYDPAGRATLRAGLLRVADTLLGIAVAVAALQLFGVHKWLLPLGLAAAVLVGGALRRFHDGRRVLLITVCLIVGSVLLAPGQGLRFALLRAVEVTAGSLLAAGFSWLVARARAAAAPELRVSAP